jgi:phosphatidylglycerophosphatase A
MRVYKLFATSFGIGYINKGKGAGTAAAAVCSFFWYLAWVGQYPPAILSVIVTVIITLVGVWSSAKVVPVWGEDPSRVVIDEVAGMCIGLLFLPVNFKTVIGAFILFRFFDMVKPLGIKKTEALPGGWGIMTDDIVAGVYTNVLMQAVVALKLV